MSGVLLILGFALWGAFGSVQITHQNHECDSNGWVRITGVDCNQMDSVAYFQNLKDILYPKDSIPPYVYYPDNGSNYICNSQDKTAMLNTAHWSSSTAYILLTVQGGSMYNILILQANHWRKPPTTILVTTATPTTEDPTTVVPTTEMSTTVVPTTEVPTTVVPTTEVPTTEVPTTVVPVEVIPTTEVPTTVVPVEVVTTEEKELDEKNNPSKANQAAPQPKGNVMMILLGGGVILGVIVLLLITLRNPVPKNQSLDIYDWELMSNGKKDNGGDSNEDTREKDQAILRRLNKGASDVYYEN